MSISFLFTSLNVIANQRRTYISSLVKCIVIFGGHVHFSTMISCIGVAIYSFIPIITTIIIITKEDVLIPGSKWYSWLFSPTFFLSLLFMAMIINSWIFKFPLWELGIFSFNFLIDAKIDTKLVKYISLVAQDLIKNFNAFPKLVIYPLIHFHLFHFFN